MKLSWRGRRQLIYYGVGILVLAVASWGVYAAFFTTASTCFDGWQNGDETGVDCGGNTCSLVCAGVARDPQVLWARSFPNDLASGAGQSNFYTAVAYVKNSNVGAATRHVRYSFQLFDNSNLLIVERDGFADLPPQNTIPIIEPNISVGQRTVARTLFAFADDTFVWNKVPANKLPSLHLVEQELNSDASRLSVTIKNESLIEAHHVAVVAVLFDANGTARGASKSILESVLAQGSAPVVFTWPQGVANITRAEVTILPSL